MNHYYKLLQESATGHKLHEFWHACIKAEEAAENYARLMGAECYYSDPKYFAGGVACVSFAEGIKPNPKMWREAGEIDGQMQYEPNVDKRGDLVEVPDADYKPQNSFDCLFSQAQPAIERNGKWYRQCLRFEYHEPEGRSANGKRVASRDVRKAIKAEVMRMRLPVVKVERLLEVLQADWLPEADGKPRRGLEQTPTFFAYEQYYIIGCQYECKAKGLVDITPQQHRTFQDLAVRLAKVKKN